MFWVEGCARLSDDELNALVERAKSGDSDARERVVMRFVPIVRSIAKRYAERSCPQRTVDVDDLTQIAVLGIFAAIKTHTQSGCPFLKRVLWYAHGHIKHELAQLEGPIRVPAQARTHWRKWLKARDELTEHLRRVPNREEIQAWSGLTDGMMDAAEFIEKRRAKSHQTPARSRRTRRPPEWRTDQQRAVLNIDTRELLEKLPADEARAVRMRFGLDGDNPPLTLAKAAKKLRVSPMTVFNVSQRGLDKLAAALA